MKIKYRKKVYDSDDLPLFLYFKVGSNRREFAIQLSNYTKLGEFIQSDCIHSVLAGNTVIKDRRAKIYFSIERADEKKILLKSLFEVTEEDSNAMLCSPNDIGEEVLQVWIEKNLEKLK